MPVMLCRQFPGYAANPGRIIRVGRLRKGIAISRIQLFRLFTAAAGLVLGLAVSAQGWSHLDVPCLVVANGTKGLVSIISAQLLVASDGETCALGVEVQNLTAVPIVSAYASICPYLPLSNPPQEKDDPLWGGSCGLDSCFGYDRCKSPSLAKEKCWIWPPGGVQMLWFRGDLSMVQCDPEWHGLVLSIPYICFLDGAIWARYRSIEEENVHCN